VSKAVSNTSPLLYLHLIGEFRILPSLFERILVPSAVVEELRAGEVQGYDVPDLRTFSQITVVETKGLPSIWLVSDLGPGETAALSLAFEHPEWPVLLDDALARRIAEAAGLKVWGTLRLLLQAKEEGLLEAVTPLVKALRDAGMWITDDLVQRVSILANE